MILIIVPMTVDEMMSRWPVRSPVRIHHSRHDRILERTILLVSMYHEWVNTSCQANIIFNNYSSSLDMGSESMGSLSNYDDDHNDDFKKTIGLMIKTTALHVHHAF